MILWSRGWRLGLESRSMLLCALKEQIHWNISLTPLDSFNLVSHRVTVSVISLGSSDSLPCWILSNNLFCKQAKDPIVRGQREDKNKYIFSMTQSII